MLRRKGEGRAPRFDGLEPSSEVASAVKRKVPRAGTRAEVALRRGLWARSLRYRLNVARLPGKPDVVFRRARVAVFCDGDFWHGRDWIARRARLAAGANAAYWVAKIEANIARDRRHEAALRGDGWLVLRFWETEILAAPELVAEKIEAVVRARTS